MKRIICDECGKRYAVVFITEERTYVAHELEMDDKGEPSPGAIIEDVTDGWDEYAYCNECANAMTPMCFDEDDDELVQEESVNA